MFLPIKPLFLGVISPMRATAVSIREGILVRQAPCTDRPPCFFCDSRVRSQRNHCSTDVRRCFRHNEVLILLHCLSPRLFCHAKVIEHRFRAQEARR